MSAAARPPLVAVSLDGPWAAAAPGEIARVAARLDAAGADLLILGGGTAGLDPLVLAAWLALATRRMGLVPVLGLPGALPFHAARALSALDVLTRAGSGWAPSSLGQPSGEGAAARALDLIDATCALWDSWDADALVIDKAGGLYLDPARVRRVDYRGPVFSTLGPLNACRPPQGHPVLVQSDADPLWRLTAARADVLLVDDPEALAERRRAVAEAGGGARLLATLPIGQACDLAGMADGVHFVATDPAAADAVAEALTSDPRRAPPRERTGSLRAALGLDDHGDADPTRLRFRSPAA